MTASCKPGTSEELRAAAVLLIILVDSDAAVRLVEAEEKGLVLPPGGGGNRGLVNLGKSVEGSRAVASCPPLPGNWNGEAPAAGGRPSGVGVGKQGTGTPAVWDKYVTNLRSSSIALLCIRM